MKDKITKAFTLVEVMIVVVLIGLLVAMAIPAFQKVKEASVVKRVENGQKLTEDERVIYKRYLDKGGKKAKYIEYEVEKALEIKSNEYIIIKNKNDIKEVQINGEIIYLVPIK